MFDIFYWKRVRVCNPARESLVRAQDGYLCYVSISERSDWPRYGREARACLPRYESRSVPRYRAMRVTLRPIDKRNTRTFLNRRLLRFYNWQLNAAGMQYRLAQSAFIGAYSGASVKHWKFWSYRRAGSSHSRAFPEGTRYIPRFR